MSEFKPIETQADLDEIVKARVAREREKYREYDHLKARVAELEKENSGLQSTVESYKDKGASFDKEIAELQMKVSGYETAALKQRIALENGLPFDLANRLIGDTESSLAEDAQKLAGFLRSKDPVPPLKESEQVVEKDAYRLLAQQIEMND